MQLLRLTYNFLLYRLTSFRLHGVHSPFVFDLYQNVILHNGYFRAYGELEIIRKALLQNNKIIEVTDLGAGSKNILTKTRLIKDIVRVSAKPAKYAQLLFRLVNYFQPQTILEIGTSVGLTTAYLAAANSKAKIFTLEGCANTANQANKIFGKLKLKNVSLLVGNFEETLPTLLAKIDTLDFVYFDGNHRYEPTMRYFAACLEKHTESSIFVLDDIYWSEEMEKAWKEICQHPAVTISVDLFQIGILFFRKQQPKQHFTLWF